MAELRASQLIIHINSFLSAATQRLHPLLALGDNPASSASDMHGTPAPSTEVLHALDVDLPAAPAKLRSTAECEAYLASLPGGPAAIRELAARAAAFKEDVAHRRIRPELAGPGLHTAVVDVSSRLLKEWPRSAEAFDSEISEESLIDQRPVSPC